MFDINKLQEKYGSLKYSFLFLLGIFLFLLFPMNQYNQELFLSINSGTLNEGDTSLLLFSSYVISFIKMFLFQSLNKHLTSLLKNFLKVLDSLLRSLAILFLNAYKLILSPFMGFSCRFYPTCSAYSRQAYEEFNFLKATYLTFKRVLSCRPFGKQGYDPVVCCDADAKWRKNG